MDKSIIIYLYYYHFYPMNFLVIFLYKDLKHNIIYDLNIFILINDIKSYINVAFI